MTSPDPALRPLEIPRAARAGSLHPDTAGATGTTARPHLDARTTGWLLEQRARIGALELENARLRGELDTSSRVERGAQRVCDRLETELERGRQREARLAHALGYAEAQRDRLAGELEARAELSAPAPAPARRRLLGRAKR